jgi:hypothetical protein
MTRVTFRFMCKHRKKKINRCIDEAGLVTSRSQVGGAVGRPPRRFQQILAAEFSPRSRSISAVVAQTSSSWLLGLSAIVRYGTVLLILLSLVCYTNMPVHKHVWIWICV